MGIKHLEVVARTRDALRNATPTTTYYFQSSTKPTRDELLLVQQPQPP